MSADTLSRAGVRVTAREIEAQAASITRRVLEDAFTQASAAQWRRRADTLEWARPKPTDYNGRATAEELAERDARLASLARACRWHARLIEHARGEAIRAELAELLAAEGVA